MLRVAGSWALVIIATAVVIVVVNHVVAATCCNYQRSLRKLQSEQNEKFTWSLFCPFVTNSFPTLTLGCRSDLSKSVVLTPSRNATFSASVHARIVHATYSVRYILQIITTERCTVQYDGFKPLAAWKLLQRSPRETSTTNRQRMTHENSELIKPANLWMLLLSTPCSKKPSPQTLAITLSNLNQF